MDELRACQILGIEPGCSREELRAAYANLSKKYHPEESPEEFQQIHEAYALLKGRARHGSRKNTGRQETENFRQEPEHSRQEPEHSRQEPEHFRQEEIYPTQKSEQKNADEQDADKQDAEIYHFDEMIQKSLQETETTEDQGRSYDFEDALRQGERRESQRIHESVLRALAEMQILLSPQYCNNMKLMKAFFAKPEYQEAIHMAEFVSGFADLLEDKKLKKSLYSYFVNVYRLRGADPDELAPEMRKLYVILDQKTGGIKNNTNQKFFYGGISAAVVSGIRAAGIRLEEMRVVIVLLYIAVTVFVCYQIFKKIYENHSGIFAQAIVAIFVFVLQIVAVLTPLNSKIFASVETGDVFGVLIMALALLWLGILGVAFLIQVVRRNRRRK